MADHVAILYAVKRKATVQLLYYCPSCEAVNEIALSGNLASLRCRECDEQLSAIEARVEAINPPTREQ